MTTSQILQGLKCIPDADYDALMAKRVEQNRKERAVRLTKQSGVEPARFAVNLKPHPRWDKAFDHVVAQLGKGAMLALTGDRGNGKSQIGVECVRLACLAGKTAAMTTFMRMMCEFKASFRDGESTVEVLERFTGYRLLVIDEIGKIGGTDFDNRMFFEVLNGRYEKGEKCDTILIGNGDVEQFKNSLGASICSRLNHRGGIITCGWESFRT